MPPKSKFTTEEIISTALSLVRSQGVEALTARSLAEALGTSPKPIFGLFESMQDLTDSVMSAAGSLYEQYLADAMADPSLPPYKASGMGYIRFARQEPYLFKWLFMRDRTGQALTEDRESIRPLLKIIMERTGLCEDRAYLFHLEMWLYVHGIATMIATGYLDWDMEFVSNALSDAYWGLLHRFTEESTCLPSKHTV